jgi:periplasmic mercuric ion binding protein
MIRIVAPAALALLLASWTAQAAEKTVVLSVENASCELCVPIVKKTLARVAGVKTVQVAEANTNTGAVATVTFDDAVTTVPALVAATTNAGYPSRLAN